MKFLIWLGCIFLYSLIQTACMQSGILLGGSEAIVLAALFVFIPAPLLCKAWSKHKAKQNASPMTHYELLGVPFSASGEDIQRAYRTQCRLFDPTTTAIPPKIARARIRQINEAYSVLRDPKKRSLYDLTIPISDISDQE